MIRAAVLAVGFVLGGTMAFAGDFTTYKGHGGPVMALDVGPDGHLVSGSFDNSVGVWQDSDPVWLEGHDAAVTTLTVSSNGTAASGGDDFAIWLWGETAKRLTAHKGKITSLDFAPDGKTLASGSWDGDIRIWNLDDESSEALEYPGSGVNDVLYSTDGKALFAATSKGVILRYNLQTATFLPLVKHGFGVNRMAIGPGWLAYGAVDGGTRVIDPQTGTQLHDFTLERRPILAVEYHAATRQLAIGDGHGYISIIDTANWKIAKDFRAMRDGPVWALAFSDDGTVIHAGGIDDVIYAWPVALLDDFEPAQSDQRSFLRDVATMPNGERQFMRKCSICHALEAGPSRKAGPTLHGVFGRRAGTLDGYRYSSTLQNSDIIWTEETVDALFDEGPDHYIPGSKMPMQVIAKPDDRADLIGFLKTRTGG